MTDFKLPKFHESRTHRVSEQIERIKDLRNKAEKAEELAGIFEDYVQLVTNARQSTPLQDMARDEIITLCNRRIEQMHKISQRMNQEADGLEAEGIHD
jgi:hypothetical protein